MKIIFITGGVVSSLGKGIVASSLARLMEDGGVNVGMMKCDPYLNIDPGTMSPIEHGEVFVTVDGGEADLDLGHYERFLGKNLTKGSSLTSGKVYQEVLRRERRGDYEGKTVQVVPHVTNLIKEKIYEVANQYDVLVVEIGGSVGDIESLSYTEAIRNIQYELQDKCAVIHAGYVPYIKVSKELKTKPMQRSINQLRSLGVLPNFLVTRSEIKLEDAEINKIAMFGNVQKNNIFQCVDVDSIYLIPSLLKDQGFASQVSKYLGIELKDNDRDTLKEYDERLRNPKGKVKIAIVGKYVANKDSYISVIEALKHAGSKLEIAIEYDLINSRENVSNDLLSGYDGILVPGGFGPNGVDGKLQAIKFARENNIPYLGICYGMQLATIEFANNVLGLNVDHGEWKPESDKKIIDIIDENNGGQIGGTLRLGEYLADIKPGTLTEKIYGSNVSAERHRHRYEFNNEYEDVLKEAGFIISAKDKELGLAEIIENTNNDFFVASQAHPELKSKVDKPSELFLGFIQASINNK